MHLAGRVFETPVLKCLCTGRPLLTYGHRIKDDLCMILLSSLRMDQMVLKTYSDLILIISRKKYHLKQGSQTQIYRMATFQKKKKMLRGP